MSEYYYDRQGQLITLEQWVVALSNKEIQRVAVDQITEECHVSTVWLGLNHQWGDGPPMIFETMIFGASFLDGECERYSTEQEALEGHARMVAYAKNVLGIFDVEVHLDLELDLNKFPALPAPKTV